MINLRVLERAIYIIVILIITAFSIIEKRNQVKNFQTWKDFSEEEISALNLQRRTEMLSEDFILDKPLSLINGNRDTISLLSLSKRPKIILYINPNACNICLDSLFISITSVFGSETSDIAIMSSAEGYRDILVQLSNSQYAFPHYCLLTNLEIPLCDEEVPFLFWLDSDLIAKHLYIPDKDKTENNVWYLNFVRDKLLRFRAG